MALFMAEATAYPNALRTSWDTPTAIHIPLNLLSTPSDKGATPHEIPKMAKLVLSVEIKRRRQKRNRRVCVFVGHFQQRNGMLSENATPRTLLRTLMSGDIMKIIVWTKEIMTMLTKV
uniref:Uncharacterized protein n=1 Tax=Spongospora subterranea TaxID=70186 RepID=A0A0H5RDZ3_9EUKA|eukprot:CRZ12228.1 hypothetical protein [Spongospora subterranea]